MERDEIILRIRQLDREQLEQLRQFLGRLEDRPENQTPVKGPDPAAPESVK